MKTSIVRKENLIFLNPLLDGDLYPPNAEWSWDRKNHYGKVNCGNLVIWFFFDEEHSLDCVHCLYNSTLYLIFERYGK